MNATMYVMSVDVLKKIGSKVFITFKKCQNFEKVIDLLLPPTLPKDKNTLEHTTYAALYN